MKMKARLVRKLENFSRLSLGPWIESVFKTGLTFSVELGIGKEAAVTRGYEKHVKDDLNRHTVVQHP
jgi:hypothetical protein